MDIHVLIPSYRITPHIRPGPNSLISLLSISIIHEQKPPNLQKLLTGPALPYSVLLKSLIWANFKISMEFTYNGYPCFNTFLGHQCSLNTLIRAFHHLKTSELGCFSCSNMLEMDLQEFIFKPIYLVSYYLFYLVYFLLISLLNISVIYEQKPPNLQKLLYRPCVSLFKQG